MTKKIAFIIATIAALQGCGGPLDYFVEDIAGIEYPYFCQTCQYDTECEVGTCETVYAVDQEAFWDSACVPTDWSPGGRREEEYFICNHVSRHDEDPWRSDYE